MLTIRRRVNQRAFLAIESLVVVLLPLSMWPIIVSCIWVVWTDYMEQLYHTLPWVAKLTDLIGTPMPGNALASASVIGATVSVLGLNTAFFLFISIAAIIDKFRGDKFLPVYPGESSLSTLGSPKKWYLLGKERTPVERAVMMNHCAEYVFQNSVFRKHR